MRTGEVFALTWNDIDLQNRLIRINKTVYSKLKDEKGSYAGTDVIKYPFKIIHHELKIENCRFYDLRGSYATKCLRNGVEIKDVADILGHKRIETTENYYISSTIEDIQKVSAVLENIIQSDITNKIINFE